MKTREILRSPASRTSQASTFGRWHCGPLEPRLLLAADVAVADVAVAEVATAEASPARLESKSEGTGDVVACSNIVFIDADVAHIDELSAALIEDAEVHLLPRHGDAIRMISEVLSHRRGLQSLHILSHGVSGALYLGGKQIDAQSLLDAKADVQRWRGSFAPGFDIRLYGCDVASGTKGSRLVDTLRSMTGCDIAASTDRTGHQSLGGDWDLEHVVGTVQSSPVFDHSLLAAYRGSLTIVITAAGTTGEERMELQIDEVTVKAWNAVGGDAYGGVLQTFIYETDEVISADRVRIAFTNDLYEPGVVDRNLRVDSVRIDGVRYETESPAVFSTGTWKAADGIVPGFRESEYLMSNGYFQYSSAGASPLGSLIEIHAAGDLGTETMQLGVRGEIVQAWENVGGNPYAREFQTFQFRADQLVSADDIQVFFTNDFYEFGTPDRNLHVDRITIDGVVYETEADTVFSTGTFLPQDGVVPGFRRSETLHASGFFQFSEPQLGTGSAISILAAGDVGTERMELWIDDQVVKSWNGVTRGAQELTFQTYNFRADGLVTADRIKIAFTNDAISNGLDRNLRVDKLIVDGVVFETEAPTVFSTGTWTPSDGIVPGYREREYLNSNGYFQFEARALTPGVVSIESSVVNVKENQGLAAVRILRSQGSDGFVSVDYATFSSSAMAGEDFIGQSGTITFAPGETEKTVLVALVDDAIPEANDVFGFAIDNVTGGAVLLAPRTATVTITDDDVPLPSYPSFADPSGLTLNGSALVVDELLMINGEASGSIGSAFFESPILVSADSSFQSHFHYEINPADVLSAQTGFAFVIQSASGGPETIGTPGAAFGYTGVTNSLAVRFDAQLLFGTPTENVVSLMVDGVPTPMKSARTPLVDFELGATAYAWVDYNGSNDRLRVYVSSTPIKPVSPILSETIDLSAFVGTQAFVGFTAGSELAGLSHRIRDWTLNLDQPSAGSSVGGVPGLVAETVVSGLFQPIAIRWSPDSRNLYVAQKNGVVEVIRDGVKQETPFIDISAIVNSSGDRGLSDIALHPDFANSPFVYLLYTYDPPEVNNYAGDPLAGPDGAGNRAGRLVRVTADVGTDYTSVVAGSEVILLGSNSGWDNFNGFVNSTIDSTVAPAGILEDGSNLRDFIAADSTSHSVNSVMFGPDGALYVSIGDGSSFNRVDTRAFRVQDIDNLSGKILRIDPITGDGLPDNPFFNGDPLANQSKVYQYGLRNPFRFAIDSRDGQLYVGDVGWTNWEEINAGAPGANFGWPFYEGGSSGNQPTIQYSTTPEAIAFYASSHSALSPLISLNHSADNINALIAGDIYLGSEYPSEYFGSLFFNDLGQGIVRRVSFDAFGAVEQIEVFATGATYVVQIIQGPDEQLYYVDLDDGLIGRWSIV